MELNTAEKFLFIIQHPKRAGTRVMEQQKNAGLIGAIICDLVLAGNIDLNGNRIRVIKPVTNLSEAHSWLLSRMTEKKVEKKIRYWIAQNINRTRKLRYPLQDRLAKKNLVRIEEKKFLFIPYRDVYLIDSTKQMQLLDRIRKVILQGKEIDNGIASLLGIAYGSKLHRIIGLDKNQKREIRKKLKEIIKDDAISQSVDAVIRETNAAIAGAVAASSAAAAASAAGS